MMRLIIKSLLLLSLISGLGGYLKSEAKPRPAYPCLMVYNGNYPHYQVNYYTGRYTAFEAPKENWDGYFWKSHTNSISEDYSLELVWEKPWEDNSVDLYLNDKYTHKRTLMRKAFSEIGLPYSSVAIAWSPNQRYLALFYYKGGKQSVLILDTQGKIIDEIRNIENLKGWSEDGRYLILYEHTEENYRTLLHWDSQDKSLLREILSQDNNYLDSLWSPSYQNRILYGINQKGQLDVYKFSYDTHRLMNFQFRIENIQNIKKISWSPNGRDVFLWTTEGNLYLIVDETSLVLKASNQYPFSTVTWLENGRQLLYWQYDDFTETYEQILYDISTGQTSVQRTGIYAQGYLTGYFWQEGTKTYWISNFSGDYQAISWDWQINKILKITESSQYGYVMLWQKGEVQYTTYFDLKKQATFTYRLSFTLAEGDLYENWLNYSDSLFWYKGISEKSMVGGLYDAQTGKNIASYEGLSSIQFHEFTDLKIIQAIDEFDVSLADIYDAKGNFLYRLLNGSIDASGYDPNIYATYTPTGKTEPVLARLTPQGITILTEDVIQNWNVIRVFSEADANLVIYENHNHEYIAMLVSLEGEILGHIPIEEPYLALGMFSKGHSNYYMNVTDCSIRPEWRDHIIARGWARMDK